MKPRKRGPICLSVFWFQLWKGNLNLLPASVISIDIGCKSRERLGRLGLNSWSHLKMYQWWRRKTLHFQWKQVLLLPKCDIQRTHHKKVQNQSPRVRLECWQVESWHFSYETQHQRRLFTLSYIDQYVFKVPFSMCHPLISCITGNKAFSLQNIFSIFVSLLPNLWPPC